MNTSACRSCSAKIIWARTRAGRAIPLDADPRADGNFYLSEGRALRVGDAPVEPIGPRYVSHFVTCPDSREWRKTP